MNLNWLVGKHILDTQVERADKNLELWFKLANQLNCFVMVLNLPNDMDWFETDAMTLEDTHGRIVGGVDHILIKDPMGRVHHTYRLMFTDGTYIDIFADVRIDSGTYMVREQLSFRIEDPDEEPWDSEESQSILSEIEAATEQLRREREVREAGQLDPRIVAQYTSRF